MKGTTETECKRSSKDIETRIIVKNSEDLKMEHDMNRKLLRLKNVGLGVNMLGNTTRFLPRQAELPNVGGTLSSPSGSHEHGVPTATRPSPCHVLENEEQSGFSQYRSPHRGKSDSKYSPSPIRLSPPSSSQVLPFLAGSIG